MPSHAYAEVSCAESSFKGAAETRRRRRGLLKHVASQGVGKIPSDFPTEEQPNIVPIVKPHGRSTIRASGGASLKAQAGEELAADLTFLGIEGILYDILQSY